MSMITKFTRICSEVNAVLASLQVQQNNLLVNITYSACRMEDTAYGFISTYIVHPINLIQAEK